MVRNATQEDAQAVFEFVKSAPDFCEDGVEVTIDGIANLINNCVVGIGKHGVFIADEITNGLCRVHPLWRGENSKAAMLSFLDLLQYRSACGFVPEHKKNVAKFFKKCGFNKVGTLKNSIRLGGEFRDQVIYQRDLLCR